MRSSDNVTGVPTSFIYRNQQVMILITKLKILISAVQFCSDPYYNFTSLHQPNFPNSGIIIGTKIVSNNPLVIAIGTTRSPRLILIIGKVKSMAVAPL